MKDELGLHLAWLEDEPLTIAKAVSYLEERNFVVDTTSEINEFEEWIHGNGYHVVLTDLLIRGHQRQGPDVIRELRGGGVREPIIAVSRYLHDFENHLKELSEEDVTVPAIDKESLSRQNGLASFRRALIERAGGGQIRVVERVMGYIEEDLGEEVLVRIQTPAGTRETVLFERKTLARLGIDEHSKFMEIKTIEKQHGNGLKLETLLRRVTSPHE